jgi:tetratricopeptide (TPR) repeat protein
LSTNFAFAWTRVAELEFSFGRVGAARRALDHALALAPLHAQAHALHGFLLSADNRITDAFAAFNEAIRLDPGLGNAWLGRGLCQFRRGRRELGFSDLSTAAVLEPDRSLLHSYLAKAYAEMGEPAQARKELKFAAELDPNDPTPLLYSGLLLQENNQVNSAVEDLNRSVAQNDNRAVYRSQLLLDQDRAVRGANLASVYRDAGMFEFGHQEAASAVSADYANFSAHLFLANSYSELLPFNPQVNLRYETPRVSEYLIATLLAPVGADGLSPTVSQQEYSKLFTADGFGLTSATEYLSRGAWTESAAQWGTFGNFGYALDAYYQSDPGQRANNDLELTTLSARFKQQITGQDTVYLQILTSRAEFGDLAQYYDLAVFGQGTNAIRSEERQLPIVLAGYHRDWSPQHHTILLAARLHDVLEVANPLAFVPLLVREMTNGPAVRVFPMPTSANDYENELEIYSAELQHIFSRESYGLILGGRYQNGSFSLHNRSVVQDFADPGYGSIVDADWVDNPKQVGEPDFERMSGYAYAHWQILEPLQLLGGLAYDQVSYPENFRQAPLSFQERTDDQLSPKGGFVLRPSANTTVRGAYSQSLGGASIDQSFHIEPTQVAGFNQAWRSLIPESVAGASAGERFQSWSAALEQKLPTRTYAVATAEWLSSEVSRSVGAYELIPPFADPFIFQTTTRQRLDFAERVLTLALNQLLGDDWTVGAHYRLSDAELDASFPEFPASIAIGAATRAQHVEATLHQLNLQAIWNHPSGFFFQTRAVWSAQSNRGYQPDQPGDDFWQFDVYGGYRFPRRRAEIRLGVLNLADQDYRLNPLNLTAELPRERTFAAALRFTF